ncbi:MAG: signal peptidase I [Candidatus Pacebacteria bacterium]|nr:signal peptidase I [Candidatus Paceibacterota bacterium]
MLFRKLLTNWIVPIISGLVLAFVIYNYLFFIVVVPSESMRSTIDINDRLIVTRNCEDLSRQNVMVFRMQTPNGEQLLIKRLIGLPGDSVKIVNGETYVNKKKIEESYINNPDNKSFFGNGVEIPADNYLFLGDNRSYSYDGRYWQNPFISEDDIVGKAVCIIYPFNRFRIFD